MSDPAPMPREMHEHYRGYDEAGRLTRRGSLELERSRELILRYVPDPPAVICDVGGGPGTYACWLARAGYEVHLVDIVPRHVDEALDLASRQPGCELASAAVGDARDLDRAEASADAVLLMGPLYHLTEREERVRALAEAARVVRPGGVVLAAVISRYASALDGLARWLFADPAFEAIVDRDLADGQHRNPTGNPGFFTTAYFHRPDEPAGEIVDAGLDHEATLAIEGPGWLMPELMAPEHAGRRPLLMSILRRIEAEPSLLGVSSHLMAVGRKAPPPAGRPPAAPVPPGHDR